MAAQFEGNMLTAAFVSHIPELVEEPNAPDLWIHGHTHAAFYPCNPSITWNNCKV